MNETTMEQPVKKPRKPRVKYVQPPGCVMIPNGEHFMRINKELTETEAGLVAELREAASRALWSEKSKQWFFTALFARPTLEEKKKFAQTYCVQGA